LILSTIDVYKKSYRLHLFGFSFQQHLSIKEIQNSDLFIVFSGIIYDWEYGKESIRLNDDNLFQLICRKKKCEKLLGEKSCAHKWMKEKKKKKKRVIYAHKDTPIICFFFSIIIIK